MWAWAEHHPLLFVFCAWWSVYFAAWCVGTVAEQVSLAFRRRP